MRLLLMGRRPNYFKMEGWPLIEYPYQSTELKLALNRVVQEAESGVERGQE